MGAYPHSLELESLGTQSLRTTFNGSEIEEDLVSFQYLAMVGSGGNGGAEAQILLVDKELEKYWHFFTVLSTWRCVLVYQVARSLPSLSSPFVPAGIGPRPAGSWVQILEATMWYRASEAGSGL